MHKHGQRLQPKPRKDIPENKAYFRAKSSKNNNAKSYTDEYA